jgi:peptidoglycan hydrolase-like protein with peptidoglycan-binding domain
MSNNPLTLKRASAVAVTVFVAAFCILSVAESKAAPQSTPQAKRKSKSAPTAKSKSVAHKGSTSAKGKHSARSVKGSKRRLPRSSRARLAQLHLDPQRVTEIQQALIREGALNGPPTGSWDDATRDAMRRYQTNNGFSATGLPDAKSLMKLGLGPHPLPEDVQATASAQQSRNDTLTKPNPN